MAKLNVGDLVEARKGERVIRDRVTVKGCHLVLGAMGWSLRDVRLNGYTLSLVEAATPLPSEPGFYKDNEGDGWKLAAEDRYHEQSWYFDGLYMTESEAAVSAPFTRLEPVPDTAKNVLDATIRTFNSKGGSIVDALISVSQEFGVSDARG